MEHQHNYYSKVNNFQKPRTSSVSGINQTEKNCKTLILRCQKMKFSTKDFFSKCYQICRKLRISSHVLKTLSMENFIFCAVLVDQCKTAAVL